MVANNTRLLFGTDGVRGVANQHPMTAEMAMRLGRAVGYQLQRTLKRRPKVLIGKDTRLSGYMIENALVSGLCSVGADVELAGPLPTPGVAFLTAGMRADAGLMISASHNPFEDNGIKVFARDGYKLPDEEEARLEALMASDELENFRPTGQDIGRAHRIHDAAGRYAVFAKMAFPRDLTLLGLRIVVDCAHGAAYRVAPEVLSELGADIITMGVSPNGTNINDGCGATAPKAIAARVLTEGADLGIALDGDADRCIMIDHNGQVVDGDQVLALLARSMIAKGQLADNTLVATIMSNLGLERSLREVGGKVVRVGVGDRYVVERMRADGYNLGGEQSGHVIHHDHSTTGDGLVTALSVLGVVVESGRRLSRLANCMQRYPQVLRNLEVAVKTPLEEMPAVQATIAAVEQQLGADGRVLVRYSGTQNMVRVMVEGPEQGLIEKAAAEISAALEAALG